KGQEWLVRNHSRLTIPIRSHLGATINFQAGTVRRAPEFLRAVGMEWLWRIKEEPYLWRRYVRDGTALLRLILLQMVPLTLFRILERETQPQFSIRRISSGTSTTIEVV